MRSSKSLCNLLKVPMLRARQQAARNPPIEIDAIENYLESKNKKIREKANIIFNKVR